MNIEELYDKYKSLEAAEALALGGSRASGNADENSDYDLYVYSSQSIGSDAREALLAPLCSVMEIGNTYFENEDNVILTDGVHADIIYRDISHMEKYLQYVVEGGNALNGYTTCFWHNILTCEIIFDKTGELTKLKERGSVPYPQKLKQNIIEKNMNLLSGCLPSYDKQIHKAFERHDFVSINHRVTAFLASYFDVIFAVNEMTHPGEKKLMTICRHQCKVLPAKFEENIVGLFEYMFKYDTTDILTSMTDELKKILP